MSLLEGLYSQMVETSEMLTARSGAGFVKCRTAFGFLVIGKADWKGHAFFVVRGTEYSADWISNGNVGVSRSSLGHLAHAGFNGVFRDMLHQLRPFAEGLRTRGVTTIHCVGHSLGGALATLAAEFFKTASQLHVCLYTFGQPRTGYHGFSNAVTRELGPDNIFRVYHRTDIIPCIPFWPFVHQPAGMAAGQAYCLASPGNVPGSEWHSITKYRNTVREASWSAIADRSYPALSDDEVKRWLHTDYPVAFTITNIEKLNRAISYVIGKCMAGIGMAPQFFMSGGATLVDCIAWILKKGIDISNAVSGLVLALIKKIMRIIGLAPVAHAIDCTTSLIRQAFLKLSQRISAEAQRAFDQHLVNDQAL